MTNAPKIVRNCDKFEKGIRDFILIENLKILIVLVSEMNIARRAEKYMTNKVEKYINNPNAIS
tara:strand:- start:114 stop:302 length:189 start_codon:yes stop_codon:yes gene_type:complete